MSKPYSFIPFLETKEFIGKGERKTGKIYLKIEVLTPVHISQDYYDINEKDVLYKEFYKIGDRYTIPGTSIKGCIRSVSEMISYSCVSGLNFKRIGNMIPSFKKCGCKKYDKPCIICSMYGAMGKRSKIRFSDFHLTEGKADIIGIPQLRKPNLESSWYSDGKGKLIGHKIYSHGSENILQKGNVMCKYFLRDSIFEGDIIFEDLVQDEINLLCYSLGLTGDIDHKIGYGKPAYYGSIRISIDTEKTKDANKYIEYASQYKNTNNIEIQKNISLLSKEYSYKNAKNESDWTNGVY